MNLNLYLALKMAASWTAGVWTLLAALGLLSVCHFGYCEASRTSSPTSGGRKEDHGPSSLERVKRGWVWNQFFVVEEYTGTEPLYVGKVRRPVCFYPSCVSVAFLKNDFLNLYIFSENRPKGSVLDSSKVDDVLSILIIHVEANQTNYCAPLTGRVKLT